MPIWIAVLAGGALAAVGVVLLLPLPEVGLPLLLGGLRLLGRRFAWARALNARVDRTAGAVLDRYRSLPGPVRALVVLLLAALGGLLVFVALQHLL